MRLTLRTLLAWLDSLLPPEEQQALAEKVAASPLAPKLVRRIQDVVENAGLGVPRVDARGLTDDANSVAEYLDNCLAADRLEEFERICIESDMHLGEVASCHGVLAEMSRDPAAVAPLDAAARKRLLVAVRDHLAAHPLDAAGKDAEPGGHRPAEDAAGRPVLRQSENANRPRRAPVGAWVSAAVAVALLVGLATFFVRSLFTGSERRVAVNQPARTPPAPAAPAAPPPPVAVQPPAAVEGRPEEPIIPPAADEQRSVTPPASPPPEPEPQPQPPPQTKPQPEPGPDATPPANRPVEPQGTEPTVAQASPAGQPRVPQGGALAIAAAPPAVVPDPRPVPDKPVAPQPVEPQSVKPQAVVSGAGLLLHRPPVPVAAAEQAVHGKTGWDVLPAGTALADREDLIAPPASRPEITVGDVTIRLEPETRATLTWDADRTPRLELVFGRVAVRAAAAGARLGITAGGLSGVLQDGLREPVGVEVALEREPGAAAGDARMRAGIVSTTGGVRWRQTANDGGPADRPLTGIAADGLLEAGRRLGWDSRDPDTARVAPARESEWVAAPPRIDRVDAAAAAAIQSRLAAGQPFEKTLRECAADRREREENRALAAGTLALVGDYDPLARLLCADSTLTGLRSGRWRKLEQATVPLAFARGVNAAERLTRSFEEHAPAGRAREIIAMARGVSDDDLAAGGDARLVAALDSPELVVRRYAHLNLAAIVPQAEPGRGRYDPDWSGELRRDAIAWWLKQLEQGSIRRAAVPAP